MKMYDRLIAVGSVICYNVCATALSTFGTGGKIDAIAYPSDATCVMNMTDILGDTSYVVLGNGSNTLISDDGVEELVVSLKNLSGHRIEKDGIYVEAGVHNMALSRLARDNGFKGLEFLSGIPGSVGGSIFMNAGAFGDDIGSHVEYVDIARNGKIERISGQNMHFGYRKSDVGNGIIVGAKLRLMSGNPIIISNTIKKYQRARRAKQPLEPSLGSVFKRVGDTSAGYYIERAGLSGYTIGGAKVSEKHANFIVNTGSATSSDFMCLAELVASEVRAQMNIGLIREVRDIGRGSEEI